MYVLEFLMNQMKETIIEYSLVQTEFGNTVLGRLTAMILSVIRLTLCGSVLLSLSISNIVFLFMYRLKKTI